MRPPCLSRFAVAAAVLAAWMPGRAAADPICCGAGPGGKTLAADYDQSSPVLLGRFTNAKAGAGLSGGTTEFVIEVAFKTHPLIAGKERITLPRYLPAAGEKRFLIFCDVFKGALDIYRVVQVSPGEEMARYLRGAVAVKDRPLAERLRHAFDYLNSPDAEVAADAFREFAQSSYKDYRTMAKALPATRLAGWLSDPKTPLNRYSLYALLLGECGSAKDADTVRRLLDDPKKRPTGDLKAGGVEGLLLGYVLLQPKAGWPYLRQMMADGKQTWPARYSALRAIRFLWDQRPDVVAKTELVGGVASALDNADIADIAVEDLRKWQRWELCDRVLGLYGKEGYDAPITRRAILRFGLCCPTARARDFVREQRRVDAELVNDMEELLKLETPGKVPRRRLPLAPYSGARGWG